jgi:hypothetical protein
MMADHLRATQSTFTNPINQLIYPTGGSIQQGYHPVTDELMGTNLLIIANEDFSSIEVRRVGELEADRGFTAVRKVPGLPDTYMALKVLEQGDVAKTWICVFDLDGYMYLDPPMQLVSEHIKFEGLEFV